MASELPFARSRMGFSGLGGRWQRQMGQQGRVISLLRPRSAGAKARRIRQEHPGSLPESVIAALLGSATGLRDSSNVWRKKPFRRKTKASTGACHPCAAPPATLAPKSCHLACLIYLACSMLLVAPLLLEPPIFVLSILAYERS